MSKTFFFFFYFNFPCKFCWPKTPGKCVRPKEDSGPKGTDEDDQCWSEDSHVSVLYLQAANTLAPTESAVLLNIRNNLLFFTQMLPLPHIYFLLARNFITVHKFMFSLTFELHCYLLETRNPDASHQVAFTHVPTEDIRFPPLTFVCCIRTLWSLRHSPSVSHTKHLWVSLHH